MDSLTDSTAYTTGFKDSPAAVITGYNAYYAAVDAVSFTKSLAKNMLASLTFP